MARGQAMIAVSHWHCDNGIVIQSRRKCSDGQAWNLFEEATSLRVQCLTMTPLHQNRSRMAPSASGNNLNVLNEHGFVFHFYGRNTQDDKSKSQVPINDVIEVHHRTYIEIFIQLAIFICRQAR
jgi:hypothetical protein